MATNSGIGITLGTDLYRLSNSLSPRLADCRVARPARLARRVCLGHVRSAFSGQPGIEALRLSRACSEIHWLTIFLALVSARLTLRCWIPLLRTT